MGSRMPRIRRHTARACDGMDSEKTRAYARRGAPAPARYGGPYRDRRGWAVGGDSAAVSLDGPVGVTEPGSTGHTSPRGLSEAPPATWRPEHAPMGLNFFSRNETGTGS